MFYIDLNNLKEFIVQYEIDNEMNNNGIKQFFDNKNLNSHMFNLIKFPY